MPLLRTFARVAVVRNITENKQPLCNAESVGIVLVCPIVASFLGLASGLRLILAVRVSVGVCVVIVTGGIVLGDQGIKLGGCLEIMNPSQL